MAQHQHSGKLPKEAPVSDSASLRYRNIKARYRHAEASRTGFIELHPEHVNCPEESRELIQSCRAKSASKCSYYNGPVAAMMMALVGAMQPCEANSAEIHVGNSIGQVSQFLAVRQVEVEEAAVILDNALGNWIVVGLLMLALIGSIAIGVILTLCCQYFVKFLEEIAKQDDEIIIVGTRVDEQPPGLTVDQPTYDKLDKRTVGGFSSNGGACIHLDENCIIKHSCLGVKASRSYKLWWKKCAY
jgi:hypothetical protein